MLEKFPGPGRNLIPWVETECPQPAEARSRRALARKEGGSHLLEESNLLSPVAHARALGHPPWVVQGHLSQSAHSSFHLAVTHKCGDSPSFTSMLGKSRLSSHSFLHIPWVGPLTTVLGVQGVKRFQDGNSMPETRQVWKEGVAQQYTRILSPP